MYGTCDVPGCTNETYMGWAPIGEQNGKQICKYHFGRHKDPNDDFNLFDVFGFKRPAKITARPIQTGSSRCDCGQALPMKPLIKAKLIEPFSEGHKHLPDRRCKACGGEREAGHSYCSGCAKERKKHCDRERQKRRYRRMQKPHAFAGSKPGRANLPNRETFVCPA